MFRWRLLLAVMSASLGPMQFGIHSGWSNSASAPIRRFLNETLSEQHNYQLSEAEIDQYFGLYTSTQMLGGCFGGLLSSFLADKFGRRPTALIVSFCTGFFRKHLEIKDALHSRKPGMILSFLPGCLAPYIRHFSCLVLSKLLVGLFSVTAMNLQSVFITEQSPLDIRGALNMISLFSIRFGYAFGQSLGLPQLFGTDHLWHRPLNIQLVIAVIAIVSIERFCSETTNYLISKGRLDEAVIVIRRYHGADISDNYLASVITSAERELDLERESLTVFQAIRHPQMKRAMWMSLLIGLTNTFTGVEVMFTMATLVLAQIGFTHSQSALWSTAAMIIMAVFNIPAAKAADKFGRRPMMIGGAITTALLNTAFCLELYAFEFWQNVIFGYFFIATLLLFNLSVVIGPCSLAWFLPSELVPIKGRSAAQCICTTALCILAVFSSGSFMFIEQVLGPATFLIFTVGETAFAVFFSLTLPETKNRPVSDIAAELMNRTFSSRADLKVAAASVRKLNSRTTTTSTSQY